MPKEKERVLLSWSGGKDSAFALHEMRKSQEFEIVALLTAITENDERVTMHRVNRDVLEAQARAVDLPLDIVVLPQVCNNCEYTERMYAALRRHQAHGIRLVAFGDLFLDDIRDFREEYLEAIGMEAHFPLWHRDTKELAYAFVNQKFKAVVTCVDSEMLPSSYAGRAYDRAFLADLPLNVDPCGENGEFHTFVYDGPVFNQPLPLKLGEQTHDEHFHYCEITSRSRRARPLLVRARMS